MLYFGGRNSSVGLYLNAEYNDEDKAFKCRKVLFVTPPTNLQAQIPWGCGCTRSNGGQK